MQTGWPVPIADLVWKNRTQADVAIFGITAPYQVVQDYVFAGGRPITDVDVRDHHAVAVVGADIAEKLFESVDPVNVECISMPTARRSRHSVDSRLLRGGGDAGIPWTRDMGWSLIGWIVALVLSLRTASPPR